MATQRDYDILAQLYLDARERLYQTITGPTGPGTKTYANTILNQLDGELRALKKASKSFVDTRVPAAYKRELNSLYAYFTKNNLMMSAPGTFASLHQDAIYTIAREMQYQLDDALVSVGRQVTRYVKRAQDEVLRQAGLRHAGIKAASGGTVRDMQNALIKDLQDQGFMTVQYGSGKGARQVPVDAYARMVARSTTREAGNTARLNQLTANGYDLVKMTEHYPTCEICAPLQGRVYSITGDDKRFPPLSKAFGAYNNIHPNCFMSGTPILAKGVMAHSCRDYVGKVVTIEVAGGHKLAVTPNHPILTPEGWVAAGHLSKSDKVVQYSRISDFLVGENPNDIHVPTFIEDIPHTLGHSCSVSASSVKGSPEQFHGDGVNGKITIINTYGFLRSEPKTPRYKKVSKLNLIRRLKARGFFNPLRALGQIFSGALAATHCIVGMPCNRFSFFGGHSRKSVSHRLRPIFRWHNPYAFEPVVNDHFRNTEAIGYITLCHPGAIKLSNFIKRKLDIARAALGVDFRPQFAETKPVFPRPCLDNAFLHADDGRYLLNSLAGKVEVLDILHIESNFFHGKVYNLQTENEWYLANSIITHNCRHVATPFIEALHTPEEMAAEQAFANRPFVDSRSAKEIALYKHQQDENRKAREILYQYERYRAVLGDDAPKSYMAFARLKQKGGETWALMQRKYRLYQEAARNGTLPFSAKADIPETKIKDYLLSPTHSVGKHKARVIRSALGYDADNWQDFASAIQDELDKSPAAKATPFTYTVNGVTMKAVKYEVPMVIFRGSRGLELTTVWQLDDGSDSPHLVTATFPKKKGGH